jgi:hypothetical protein
MSDMNTETIYRVASMFDLDLHQDVTAAQKLLAATQTLRDKVAAETQPDYSTANTKNLAKLHQTGLDWERRGERLKVADDLVTHARGKLDAAMFTTAYGLAEPLAALFTTEAATFVQALSDLGGHVDVAAAAVDPVKAEALNRLRTAENNLDQIKAARDAFAFMGMRANTFSDAFEAISRTLVVTHRRAWELASRHPGWIRALELGMTIKWQTAADQEADAENILSQSRRSAPAGR